MQEQERWLSVEEIAVHLGVNRDTIYKWCGFRSKVTRRFGNKLPGISGQSYHVFRWKVTTFDG